MNLHGHLPLKKSIVVMNAKNVVVRKSGSQAVLGIDDGMSIGRNGARNLSLWWPEALKICRFQALCTALGRQFSTTIRHSSQTIHTLPIESPNRSPSMFRDLHIQSKKRSWRRYLIELAYTSIHVKTSLCNMPFVHVPKVTTGNDFLWVLVSISSAL